MANRIPPRHLAELYKLFASVSSPSEAAKLLEDLATPHELEAFAERWQLIQMLARGETQRETSRKLKISISKVTRGSMSLKYGKGGFAYFLKKLKIKEKS